MPVSPPAGTTTVPLRPPGVAGSAADDQLVGAGAAAFAGTGRSRTATSCRPAFSAGIRTVSCAEPAGMDGMLYRAVKGRVAVRSRPRSACGMQSKRQQ